MPRLLCAGLLLLLGACALFEPSGQRYVVFFRESSAQMDDAAEAVLAAAAGWAKKHPDMPVLVASYADPYGSEKANADFTRLRAQVVVDGLVANGVIASRIQLREVGSVKFQSDPQESRQIPVEPAASLRHSDAEISSGSYRREKPLTALRFYAVDRARL
jgi:hypothetical protein